MVEIFQDIFRSFPLSWLRTLPIQNLDLCSFILVLKKNKKIGLNKDQTYDFTHQAYQSYQIRQTHQTHSRAFRAWSPNSLEDSTLQVGVG